MTIRLFEVGGSIRDELLGIQDPPDRDFCAESPDGWEALLSWCRTNMKRVFLVTPEFFTVRGMMPNGTAIDIVMCRKDGSSSDGRHPDHVEPGTLEDDLHRRDFTINAMAREVDPSTLEPIGEIIDLFGGQDDLNMRILRTVGNTRDRFQEDGLRIFRAMRFSITKKMDFCHELETEMKDNSWWQHAKDTVSAERIREEFTKMFKHDTVTTMIAIVNEFPFEALLILDACGIWLKPTTEKKK